MPEDQDITESTEFKAALEAEVAGLKKNRDEAIDRAKEAKKALRAFDGIDPAEHQTLMEAHEAAEAEKAKAAGDWEKREATWNKKLSEKDSIIASQDERFRQTRIKAEAALAIAHHDGNPTLLLDGVTKVLQTDDDYNVFVAVDDKRLTPTEYIGTLKEKPEYEGAFPGAGTLGSGSRKSDKSTASGFKLPKGVTIIKG